MNSIFDESGASSEPHFAIVYEVRPYGLMLNSSNNSWGLLHQSNMHLSKNQSLDDYSRGDIIIVSSKENYNSRGLTYKQSNTSLDPIEIFKRQFGSTRIHATFFEYNENQDLIVHLNGAGFRNTPTARIPKDRYFLPEKPSRWDEDFCFHVDIIDYDRNTHELIAQTVKPLPKKWEEVKTRNEPFSMWGKLSGKFLNAIEVTLDSLGTLAIPFSKLPGYEPDSEDCIIPKNQPVKLHFDYINGKLQINFETKLFSNSAKEENKLRQLFQVGHPLVFIGATGSGKSSLINAILDMGEYSQPDRPEVGFIECTTQKVASYECRGVTIWDTPGVGEGELQDKKFTADIMKLLKKVGPSATVIVVLDAKSRDYGATFRLVSQVKSQFSGRWFFLC